MNGRIFVVDTKIVEHGAMNLNGAKPIVDVFRDLARGGNTTAPENDCGHPEL